MEPLVGVICPHCGCNVGRVVRAETRGGKPFVTCECDHCQREFALANHPVGKLRRNHAVLYQTTRCPQCNSPDAPVHRTEPLAGKRVVRRKHRCKTCRHEFYSVSSNP